MSFTGVTDSRWDIADQVVVELTQPIKDRIQTSRPYQDFQEGKIGCFVGPSGDGRLEHVIEYLVGHGVRVGHWGALCGLMHNVSQAVKDFFVAGDEYYALEEIQSLLAQRDKLLQGNYPKIHQEVAFLALSFVPPLPEADQARLHTEACTLLDQMLATYNSR